MNTLELTSWQKVLVVGAGPSYFDIVRKMSEHVTGGVIISTRRPLEPGAISISNQRNVPRISGLRIKNRSVCFEDSTIEGNIDTILLCTGEEYQLVQLLSKTACRARRSACFRHLKPDTMASRLYAGIRWSDEDEPNDGHCGGTVCLHCEIFCLPTWHSITTRDEQAATSRARRAFRGR